MKWKSIFYFIFLGGIYCQSCQPASRSNEFISESKSVSGKVVKIIDGDTYDLLAEGNRKIRIRMEGTDAPEREMPYSDVAKNYLSSLCFKKTVSVEITGKDAYGRTLGYTYLLDGRELSHEMIHAGLSWHYKRFNHNQELAELEKIARKEKRGLWKDNQPIPPWEVKRLKRNNSSNKLF